MKTNIVSVHVRWLKRRRDTMQMGKKTESRAELLFVQSWINWKVVLKCLHFIPTFFLKAYKYLLISIWCPCLQKKSRHLCRKLWISSSGSFKGAAHGSKYTLINYCACVSKLPSQSWEPQSSSFLSAYICFVLWFICEWNVFTLQERPQCILCISGDRPHCTWLLFNY